MKNFLTFSLIVVFLMASSTLASGETIILKSGVKLKAKILAALKDGSGMMVEVDGKPLMIPYKDIQDIEEMHQAEDMNTLPMYGGMQKGQDLTESDKRFVEAVVKETGSREAGAEAMVENGWAYFRQGDLKTAMKRFNQAWLLNPKNADIFQGFGAILGTQGDIEGAISMYQKVFEFNPNHPQAHFEIAVMYYDKKSYDLAIQYCDKAVALGADIPPEFLEALKPYRPKVGSLPN